MYTNQPYVHDPYPQIYYNAPLYQDSQNQSPIQENPVPTLQSSQQRIALTTQKIALANQQLAETPNPITHSLSTTDLEHDKHDNHYDPPQSSASTGQTDLSCPFLAKFSAVWLESASSQRHVPLLAKTEVQSDPALKRLSFADRIENLKRYTKSRDPQIWELLKPAIYSWEKLFANDENPNLWLKQYCEQELAHKIRSTYRIVQQIKEFFITYNDIIIAVGGKEKFIEKIHYLLRECAKTPEVPQDAHDLANIPYEPIDILGIIKILLIKLSDSSLNPDNISKVLDNLLPEKIQQTKNELQQILLEDGANYNLPMPSSILYLIIDSASFDKRSVNFNPKDLWKRLATVNTEYPKTPIITSKHQSLRIIKQEIMQLIFYYHHQYWMNDSLLAKYQQTTPTIRKEFSEETKTRLFMGKIQQEISEDLQQNYTKLATNPKRAHPKEIKPPTQVALKPNTLSQISPAASTSAEIIKIPIYSEFTGEIAYIDEDIFNILIKPIIEAEEKLFANINLNKHPEPFIKHLKTLKQNLSCVNGEKISNLFKAQQKTIEQIGGRKKFLEEIHKLLQEGYKTLDEKETTPYESEGITKILENLLDKLAKTNLNQEAFSAYISFLTEEIYKERQELKKHLPSTYHQSLNVPPSLIWLIIESCPPAKDPDKKPAAFNSPNFWRQLTQETSPTSSKKDSSATKNPYQLTIQQMVNQIFYDKLRNDQLEPELDTINHKTNSPMKSAGVIKRRVKQYKEQYIKQPLGEIMAKIAAKYSNL